MDGKNGKFILDIVPLARIPLTRNQSFCYISDEKLPEGTLVSIPLFRRSVEGIVVKSRSDFKRFGSIELKKIEKVIEKEFLTKNQLALADFISKYYFSPLGVVFKNFVPKRIKRIKKYELRIKNEFKKSIVLTKEQKNAVKDILGSDSKIKNRKSPPKADRPMTEKFLLFGPSSSGKTEVYIHSILELRKKNKDFQFLIMVPEQTLTPQAIERYGAYFSPEEMAILSSNIAKGQYFANWQKIKSGKAKIIIGTRMSIFAPFQKLSLVVIDEEQDISYKQWDMNPRYDARKSAEKISELFSCPIIFGSATPSVETYYHAEKKDLKLLKLPPLQVENQKLEIKNLSTEIVDMRLERLRKNASCISKKLKGEIAYALKNKLQAVLPVNRQGMSSFSVCAECKTVLKCPRCDRALVYDKLGNYRCIHCSYKTSIIPQCPQCKGVIFKNVGIGTQKVEQEIKDFFSEAEVARIDSQSIKKSGYQEEIFEKFQSRKIDILIGTQMISKGWDFPNLTLAGILDADNMLSIPDFKTREKAFQTIIQLSGRVGRPGSKFPGVFILQTFDPENMLWKKISQKDIKGFMELEISERKVLSLPPFSKIIKLVCQDYKALVVEKEAERVYTSLAKISGVSVSSPQDSYVPKIRGRSRKQLVLKLKNDPSPKLEKTLYGLGRNWIIDVDPISII